MPEWAFGVIAIVAAVSIMQRLAGHRVGRGRNQDELERRIAELEEGQRQLGAGDTAELERRVGELEERVDFAERMLAKKRDSDRLGPPPQA